MTQGFINKDLHPGSVVMLNVPGDQRDKFRYSRWYHRLYAWFRAMLGKPLKNATALRFMGPRNQMMTGLVRRARYNRKTNETTIEAVIKPARELNIEEKPKSAGIIVPGSMGVAKYRNKTPLN